MYLGRHPTDYLVFYYLVEDSTKKNTCCSLTVSKSLLNSRLIKPLQVLMLHNLVCANILNIPKIQF